MAKAVNHKQVVTIKSDEENPEPLEVIAKSIIEVSDAFQKIHESRLKKRVIVLLIKDMTQGIGITEIETILDVVPKLKDRYLKAVAK
jgi:DNA-directed RNA polymerase beta' subunit